MPSRLTNPLFIEFDGRQLTVTTDVEDVHDFVTATFRHMLVPAVTSSVGELSVLRVADGYELRGRETTFIGGTLPEPAYHMVKDEVRIAFMRSRADLLWLHAGAVERDGHALLLSGPSGQGKSTLSTLLSGRGWKYMSDDIVPVRMENHHAIPFPQTPARRVHPGREVTVHEVATLRRESAHLERGSVYRGEAPIRAVAFIKYQASTDATVARLSKGHSAFALLSNLTNFMDHRSSAVDHAVAFARNIPMFSLDYTEPESGADALSSLWADL